MWTILIIILVVVVLSFLNAVNKDNNELKGLPIQEKFSAFIQILNDAAFQGNGKVKIITNKELTLYEEGANQIIRLNYSTGHLSLIWKYKYFQEETIYKRQFNDVRNISLAQQQNFGQVVVKEMRERIIQHHEAVTDKMVGPS